MSTSGKEIGPGGVYKGTKIFSNMLSPPFLRYFIILDFSTF